MTTLAALFVRCRWYCRAATARSCGNPWGHHCRRTGNEPAPYAVYHAGVYLFFDRLRLRFSRKPKQTVPSK